MRSSYKTLQNYKHLKIGVHDWLKGCWSDPAFNPDGEADFDRFLEQRLLFITTHFRPDTNPIAEFEKFYFRLIKNVLGNDVGRRRSEQPRAFVFLDSAGTRSGRVSRDVRESVGRDVHALMMIRPELYPAFTQAFADDNVTRLSTKQLHVVPFIAEEGSFKKLISYCSKGIKRTAEGRSPDDVWTLLPRASVEPAIGRHKFRSFPHSFARGLKHDEVVANCHNGQTCLPFP